MLAVAGLVAVSVSVSKAQPYAIAGDFNGWNNTAALGGGPTIYTNIMTGGTAGNWEGFKIIAVPGSWSPTYPGNNCNISYDAGGSNTVYFYPGTILDGWLPLQNRVGFEDPGTMAWEITGDFTTPAWGNTVQNGNNGSGSDPLAQLTLQAGSHGVYTNIYVIPTAGTHNFQFRTPGTWGRFTAGSDFGNGTGNGSVTTTVNNQAVLFQLDLPNGRWLAGSAVSPVTNQVVFAVDMTIQIQAGNFNPATDQVFVSGAFNNWPGTAAGALVLTNYPTYNGGSNTNIYYGTNIFMGAPNSAASDYKFTCSSTAYNGSSGYEPISYNRSVSLLATNGPLMLPVVKFGDLYLSDYVSASTMVTFTVNMTNAVSHIDGHVFDPTADQVYINGNFIAGGWSSWNPASLTPMANNPVGSQIYTYTATVPVNSLLKIDYKYSMGYSAATNWDDEAPAYQDHFRYIRCTATGAYTNAQDTFGNQYAEPSFGQLTSASAAPGSVLVKWLGRPGVELQSNGSLAGGSWQSLVATDGTNWITGSSSANGFVSQTNWPAVGQQFFRLIQAW